MPTYQMVVHEYNDSLSGHVNIEWRLDGATVGWYGSNFDVATALPLDGGVYNETAKSQQRIAASPNNHRAHVITLPEVQWRLSKEYATDYEYSTALGNGGWIQMNCVDFADNVLEVALSDRNARISQYMTLSSAARTYATTIDGVQAWWDALQSGHQLSSPPPYMFSTWDNTLDSAGYNDPSHASHLAVLVDHYTYSPLALDLNGDGIRTISLEDSSVVFDMTGDGIRERTGWLSSADGFLAYDRNFNGSVDGVGELFGGKFGEGVAEINALDTNSDGVLDSADSTFASIQVWQDADSNGQTGSGELLSLQSIGIESINLNFDTTQLDFQNGNVLYERSTASLADGSEMSITDVYFRVSQEGNGSSAPQSNPDQMSTGSSELNGAGVPFPPSPRAFARERARFQVSDTFSSQEGLSPTRVASGLRRPNVVHTNVPSLDGGSASEEWSYTGEQHTVSSGGRIGDLNRKRLQMIEAMASFDLDTGSALDLMPRRTIDAKTHELLTATSQRPVFS